MSSLTSHADEGVLREISVAARPSSIRTARHWAVKHAQDADLPLTVVRVVELLTSEVVANAVAHAPSEPIRVRARVRPGSFTVSVTDVGTDLPVLRSTGPEVPGGHGMRLVDRLATEWGVRSHGGDGKTVWFTVTSPSG